MSCLASSAFGHGRRINTIEGMPPMSASSFVTTHDAPPHPVSPTRRTTGVAGLVTLATFAATVLVAPKQDLSSSAQLHAFLDENGRWQAVAWLLSVAGGLTWLVFVVGLRHLLPGGASRDVFTAAAVAGQAATWVGASLVTAAAPSAAHNLSLPVYVAFGEAGHLAAAAGTAATGLALLGLSRAAPIGLWSTTVSRGTAIAGVVLIAAAIIGPVSIPAYALWLLIISVLLLRHRGHTSSSAATRSVLY